MQDPASEFPMINQQLAPPFPEQEQLNCPRCDSSNTKFCYYNNYNLSQPRFFCKDCRRYWTKGGALRNIPVGGGGGGGTRKNAKRSSNSNQKRANPDPIPDSSPSVTRRLVSEPTSPPSSSSVPLGADQDPTRLYGPEPGRDTGLDSELSQFPHQIWFRKSEMQWKHLELEEPQQIRKEPAAGDATGFHLWPSSPNR